MGGGEVGAGMGLACCVKGLSAGDGGGVWQVDSLLEGRGGASPAPVVFRLVRVIWDRSATEPPGAPAMKPWPFVTRSRPEAAARGGRAERQWLR